jgi:4-amino-4-deoxy-L-arabinose transferase-like glycosyltransferase
MVALIIAATTSIFGDSEVFVRLGSLILYPLTSVFVYLIGKRLFTSRVGLVAALIFISMPAISISSLVISTDVALFFYWTLALYAFIRAIDSDAWGWWSLLGIAGGLGMQTKYTMGVFVFSAVLYVLFSNHKALFLNAKLWWSAVLAAVIWLPNLVWNSKHQYITFQHTSEISEGTETLLHFGEVVEFFVGQFGVFGLVSFAFLLFISIRVKTPHKGLLIAFTWTFLGVILIQALLGRANANWAAPAYIAGSILVAAYIVQVEKYKWLMILLVLNILLAGLLYYSKPVLNTVGIELDSKNDVYKRLRGWPELGEQFTKIRAEYPEAILLGGRRRTILAHLLYQSRPLEVATWNPAGIISHHFDLYNDLNQMKDKQFLFVTESSLDKTVEEAFSSSKFAGKLHEKVYDDYVLDYNVYYLSGFKGYKK